MFKMIKKLIVCFIFSCGLIFLIIFGIFVFPENIQKDLPFKMLSYEEKKELYLQKIEEMTSCQPEIPLSKGEIYAKAMQEYWRRQMNWVLNYDEYLGTDDAGFKITANSELCKIEDGHFKSTYCYPWRIDLPITLEYLQKKYPTYIKEGYLYGVKNLLQGKIYDPKKEDYLYQPEYYNQDAPFSIIQNYELNKHWYAPDCCRLVDYEDYEKIDDLNNKNIIKGLVLRKWDSNFPKDKLQKINFLRLKVHYLNTSGFPEFNTDGFSIYYIPVNHCGNIIPEFDDYLFHF